MTTLKAKIKESWMKFNAKWPLFFLIIALGAIGILGTLCHLKNLSADATVFKANLDLVNTALVMLGGLGVILATYLNIMNSVEATQNHIQAQEWSRIENTMNTLKAWDAQSLLAARRYTREQKENARDTTANQLIEKIQSDDNLKQSVIHVFNFFSNLQTSLELNYLKEDVIRREMGPVFQDIHSRFSPWIEKQPEEFQKHLKELERRLQM